MRDFEEIKAILKIQSEELSEVKKTVIDLSISSGANEIAHTCILEKLGDVKENIKELKTTMDARDIKIESQITVSALEHKAYHKANEGSWGIQVWVRNHIIRSVFLISIGLLLLMGADQLLINDVASPFIKFIGKIIGLN